MASQTVTFGEATTHNDASLDPEASAAGPGDNVNGNQRQDASTKRLRWATHRANHAQGQKKRQSIMARFHKRAGSDKSGFSNGTDGSLNDPTQDPTVADEDDGSRTIYFNMPLPASARDEEGNPLHTFSRNKVRTSKYTAITFIPKNLFFQFHNIANIYFLFLIILGFFYIFGVSNPGLNAVPLIVILVVTAIKDAVEDFRRTVLDNELNNSPVHRLVDWDNVNTAEDHVSLWRRFKKANTRGIVWIWQHWFQRRKLKAERAKAATFGADDVVDGHLSHNRRSSQFIRASVEYMRAQQDVEMTPVSTPRGSDDKHMADSATAELTSPNGHLGVPPRGNSTRRTSSASPRFYGSLINPAREPEGRARFKKDYWKNVQVGDFVRIYNEEPVPADVIVLATSDPDGACYIETKNLDGETNLKVRQALNCGSKIKRARDCEQTEFWIECEAPHANLYDFSGVVRWNQRNSMNADAPTNQMAEPISINNLLLRGCSLRNTEWILGVVAFTGRETKIMLNAGITPSKRAKISRDLNWNVVYNFAVLFGMCFVSGVVEGSFFAKSDTSTTFFEYGGYGGNAPVNGLITFWAAMILFQNLVPISLFISLEIIRTFQAYFIYSDEAMYYEKLDFPCTPKSWNISDDLGQIEYIFSDKTGTLTQNVMEFKKCTINQIPYGEAYTEAQAGMQKRQGIDVEKEAAHAHEQIARDKAQMIRDLRSTHNNPYLVDENLTFVAPDFVADLNGASGRQQKEANAHFMLALALCHSVITERTPGDPPRIEFKAQSPDEAALVATASDCGFTFVDRSVDGISINVQGTDVDYTILNILEFNSTRKRMSVILRMPDGRIVLFCKGADSIIYSRLKSGEQQELRRTTAEHLEMFAREGLRTLCIAEREISEDEYQAWNQEHDLAAASISNREDNLERVSDAIERELTLLGGTAIEDRLQDGVPDAIALLGRAGIKLWVLTGDKVETAINIGFSCNVLNNDMDLIIFKIESDSVTDAEAELDKHLATFGITGSHEELIAARKNHEAPAPTHAIIIDGDSLKLVLEEHLKTKFLLLCKQCKSVLCCRVSPSQKAAVVRLVKTGLDVITLAIGDGANDVAMIQQADVGVGIAGEEGRQAVMSSDYAIGQFRYLARLTLVHGRWCYRRLGETIANFFYKNIVWTFTLFWYQIYADFDCSYAYDYTYILLYNLAFTSLPVIFMGLLDQDVSDKVSLAVPRLYLRGIKRLEWTQQKFWLYMLDGLYQSVVCFYMTYILFEPAAFLTDNGRNVNDVKRMGLYIANGTVVVVNLYVMMNTYRWDWLMSLIVGISTLLVWTWTGIYSQFTAGFTFYKAASQVYGTLIFWAVTLLTIVIALLPRFTIKAVQKIYRPYDVDIVREQVRQGKFDYLNAEDSADLLAALKLDNASSTDDSQVKQAEHLEEDERPIYPPSTAHTARTGHYNHSQNGSDDTQATFPRHSVDRPARPSFDRMRSSMDRMRPSFEQTQEFSSVSQLMRLESSVSANRPFEQSRLR